MYFIIYAVGKLILQITLKNARAGIKLYGAASLSESEPGNSMSNFGRVFIY